MAQAQARKGAMEREAATACPASKVEFPAIFYSQLTNFQAYSESLPMDRAAVQGEMVVRAAMGAQVHRARPVGPALLTAPVALVMGELAAMEEMGATLVAAATAQVERESQWRYLDVWRGQSKSLHALALEVPGEGLASLVRRGPAARREPFKGGARQPDVSEPRGAQVGQGNPPVMASKEEMESSTFGPQLSYANHQDQFRFRSLEAFAN